MSEKKTVLMRTRPFLSGASFFVFAAVLAAPLWGTLRDAHAATGLVAAYALNEGAGTTAVDSSGTNNAGTVAGASWTAAGKYGGALSFDGVNDRVNIADAASLDLTTGMTLEAWVMPTAITSDWRTVVLKERPTGLAYALYATDGASRPPAAYINTGGADKSAVGTANLSLNAWTHLATTYNGSSLRLYVNGNLVRTLTTSGNMAVSSSPLRIGGNAVWGEWFSGVIDEVRVYNRALTQTEIQTDMGAPIAPDTMPPTAPTNLTAAGGVGSAALSWTAATDNVGVALYNVHRSTASGFIPSAVNRIAQPTATNYADVVASGTYYYLVTAQDAAGNIGLASNEANAVVTSDTQPPVISAVSASSITADSANITWTTDETSDSQVEHGLTTSYGTSTTLNTALVTSHAQSLSGLTASTTYHYRVKSRDVAGNLAVSGDVTFTTSAPPPGPCDGTFNPIVCENSKPGNPSGEWEISGSGDPSIQGFATEISVNKGQTVRFKINTNAANYRLDMYRMGYYGGLGARKIATVLPSVSLPQNQPSCLNNATTGLIDCGNWAESASWVVPADAVSGIYLAKLVRIDTGGASHVVFIVRDDAGSSDILFQTSDTTWQAYNQYGGNSLYVGSPDGRAYKVSYNRPFTTRGTSAEDWVFNAEYPMVRWLERNGYDVSYFTGVDSDRNGNRMLQHKVFLSVGHDEYWSGGQRANVEAARSAGVHVMFLSGNELFWKTRWESSIDASATPYRTLVSYKETHANAKIDPLPNVWTGTWRDPRFSPPADGGRPENALTGTMFIANCCTYSMTAPGTFAPLRFWRNTAIANLGPAQTYTFPNGTLGYEWDHSPDNGFQPAGLMKLSATTVGGVQILLDYGSTYGTGPATHNLTLYRHSSGALVFGAGTVQWSWGLDSNHDRGSAAPDVNMQQATVNMLADMNTQPTTLQANLVAATQSTDAVAPATVITSPANGSNFNLGAVITVQGTASDASGRVSGVEVSTDGAATWHPANGYGSWNYTWTAGSSATTTVISARAVDDSGNLGLPQSVTITIGDSPPDTTPPAVSVSAPVNGASVSGTSVTVSATASDTVGVAGVQFFLDGANLGAEDTASPYSLLWNTTLVSNGPHTITARARDAAGNTATSTAVSITVANGIVPTQGPGGPILIIAGANPFTTYYKEILLSEGLNLYRMMDISLVTASELATYDVVILGELSLTPAQATMMTDWVNAGGNLIAMRPHSSLTNLLGMTSQGTSVNDAYFRVNTAVPPGTGIVGSPLQFHGTADRYTLNGATEIATLYSNLTTSLNIPAMTNRAVGAWGGHAAAFTFDLARSVVYTRQGNPAWSGTERDGEQPPIIRSDDLFFPNWVDFANIEIPQADEAQRLLANMIHDLLAAKKPLPHFWYLPRGEKAAVIMTGDDHANGGTVGRFQQYQSASAPGCSVADWDCIRSTSYVYASTPISNAQAAAFVAQGFEIASHVNTDCANWTPSTLQSFYTNDLAAFAGAFPNVPAPQTERTHCLTWSDYDTQPSVELSHGIRLDTNYYYWPPAWVQDRPGLFTGSGFPMRFADRNGGTIDVYQATTQFPDETNFTSPSAVINTLLDNAIGLKGYYGMLTINAHTDGATAEPSFSVSNAVVNSAIARSVPVISAKQALDWLDGRNNSSFGAIAWSAASSTLSFTITQDSRARGLTTLIPAVFGNTLSTLTRNGASVPFTVVTVKGVSYAQFASDAGAYQAVYLVDTVSPAVSVTAPVSGATVSGSSVAVSAEASDNVSVAGVQFKVDGVNLGAEDLVTPYAVSWNTLFFANGNHTLTAVARDAAGNLTTSSPVVVTVSNALDTAPPVLSTISAVVTSTSATITWLTDENADSQVEYGTTTAYGLSSTLDPALVTNHSMTLNGLTASTLYHYRVKSRDAAGNLAVSADVTFTTSTARQTIFTTQVPDGSFSDGVGVNYELGMRFTSVAAGQITAVRFYKSASESGTHTGRIWNAAGQQLAAVVFTGETASGWQEQPLATPLPIAANTEYLVSVNTGNTFYVASDTGLQSQIASGDLRTIVGSNGRYGASGAYPTNTWLSSNYFRDIVFTR